MNEWHYQRGEAVFGPIAASHLLALKRRGMPGDTPVRLAGAERWITLNQAELMEIPAAAAPQEIKAQSECAAALSVYAPPKSAPILREPGPPLALWAACIALVPLLLVVAIKHLTMVLLYIHLLCGGENWPVMLLNALVGLHHFFEAYEGSLRVVAFAALLLVMVWQCCAFASLRHLYGDGMMRHGPASGLWWIVPLANLVMPALCLREMRHLSRKRRDTFQHGLPFGPLIWSLLILVVVMLLSRVCSSLVAAPSHVFAVLAEPTTAQICSQLLREGVVFGFCTIMTCVIATNLIQQIRLYRHWHNNAFWLTQ